MSRRRAPSPLNLDTHLAYMIGVLYGDGHVRKNGSAFELNVGSESFAKCFHDAAVLAGFESRPIRPGQTHFEGKIFPTWTITFYGQADVAQLQDSFGPFDTFSWRVPRSLSAGTKEIQAAFLQGFCDSEGCVCLTEHVLAPTKTHPDPTLRRVGRPRPSITIGSSNSAGLEDVLSMLEEFGLSGANMFFAPTRGQDYWSIHICQLREIALFRTMIGFRIAEKMELLRSLNLEYQRNPWSPDEDARLLSLRQDGCTYDAIARRMGLTKAAVTHRYIRLCARRSTSPA